MIIATFLFTQRLEAIERFNASFAKARLGAMVARLLARPAALSSFAEILPNLNPNRSYAGIQAIPVCQITGSVGRPRDFDRSFRPLKAHLRGRWVANYVYMQTDHLDTIRVFKIGSQYFVEDGHHRVSVARATGMAFLQAEVWEYTKKAAPAPWGAWLAPAACACELACERT